MNEATASPASFFDTMRRGMEGNDAELLASLYTNDAEIHVVDKNNPPSKPGVISGRAAIGEYYRDVCGRGLSHRIDNEVIGDNRIAFTEACLYPDGTNVLCASVLILNGGLITRQTGVQAWDE
jgi:hypothetical protein